MANFIDELAPRRGLKASSNAGNQYIVDTDLPAGIIVVPGSADGKVKAPASAAEVLTAVGVLVYPLADVAASATAECEAGCAYEVLDEGLIWCVCETAMARGAIPFVRRAAGVGEQLGALRNDADTDDATALPNCRVERTASGTGICLVKVNLPGAAS
jgi:hypothetical protein